MSDENNNTDIDPHISAGPEQLIAGMTIHSGRTANGHSPPRQRSGSDERGLATPSPLPNGILFKGKRVTKRVSFRDRQLVDIREIPARSSSAEEYTDNDEDDDNDDDDDDDDDDVVDGSSESEETTSSESEEESEVVSTSPTPSPQPAAPMFVNGSKKPVCLSVNRASVSSTLTVSKATPVSTLSVSKAPTSFTPVSMLSVTKAPSSTNPVSTVTVRHERAPIPWTPMTSFASDAVKSSHSGTAVSPATKTSSLVSRFTGVSSSPSAANVPSTVSVTSSASHLHIRPRSATISSSTASSSSSSSLSLSSPARKSMSPVPIEKAPVVVRADKKGKKITPTLDKVMTSQTVRSVQKFGIVSQALHKGSNGGSSSSTKSGRKKRSSQRRHDGSEKRKSTSARRNSDKESRQSSSGTNIKARGDSATLGASSNGTAHVKSNVTSAGGARPRPKSAMSGFRYVRDSLSLPPVSSEDSMVLTPPKKLLQHRPVAKTTVYTMDGFIFPGDPTQDLGVPALGFKASTVEDVKHRSHSITPAATQVTAFPRDHVQVSGRERASSAPTGGSAASNRRKRFYAWQMANGNLHESPCITPMWEPMTSMPVATTSTKLA